MMSIQLRILLQPLAINIVFEKVVHKEFIMGYITKLENIYIYIYIITVDTHIWMLFPIYAFILLFRQSILNTH